MGRTMCALLGACARPAVDGESDLAPGPGTGLVILAAHHGPWEAGARELALRGLAPVVVAAPWPRLPRTEGLVARLRENAGVRSVPRGRAGWRAATRHLREGGTVVLLVDSASPRRRGRRGLPLAGGEIGAPDAVISWALRQGAEVRLARWDRGRFQIERLGPGEAKAMADRAVERLDEAVRASPSDWAWVRALACMPLLLPLLSCDAGPLPPPLPDDPSRWMASATDVTWTGPLPGALPGDLRARLHARTARLTWRGGAPAGRFEALRIDFGSAGGREIASLAARSADGAWPDGPLLLRDVEWTVAEPAATGATSELTWRPDGSFHCGGCPIEMLHEALFPGAQKDGAGSDPGDELP